MSSSKSEIVISYIKRNVEKGIWKAGDKIFSEDSLGKELGVSRITVRDALSRLCTDGIITKKHGSGNYISEDVVSNSEKYMIIVTKTEVLNDIEGYTYRKFIEELDREIANNFYKSYVHMKQIDYTDDILDNINIDPSNIAGIFASLGNNNVLKKIVDLQIPIVSCLTHSPFHFHSVSFDFSNLFNNFKYLINNYNLKKNLIIAIDNPNNEDVGTNFLVHTAIAQYLGNFNNDNIIYTPWDSNFKDTARLFREKLLSLNYIPDSIIFTDDCAFVAASKIFNEPEIANILQKTKIITHANKDRDYYSDFPICKIEFDISEMTHKAMKIMLKIINKECLEMPNEFINSRIVNEEIFK